MAKTTVVLATTYVTTRASKHGALLCAAEQVGKSVTGGTVGVGCTGTGENGMPMVTATPAGAPRPLTSIASRCQTRRLTIICPAPSVVPASSAQDTAAAPGQASVCLAGGASASLAGDSRGYRLVDAFSAHTTS